MSDAFAQFTRMIANAALRQRLDNGPNASRKPMIASDASTVIQRCSTCRAETHHTVWTLTDSDGNRHERQQCRRCNLVTRLS